MRRIGDLKSGDCFWLITQDKEVLEAHVENRIDVNITGGPNGIYLESDLDAPNNLIVVTEKFIGKCLYRFSKPDEQYVLVSDPHFLKFKKYIHEKDRRT